MTSIAQSGKGFPYGAHMALHGKVNPISIDEVTEAKGPFKVFPSLFTVILTLEYIDSLKLIRITNQVT